MTLRAPGTIMSAAPVGVDPAIKLCDLLDGTYGVAVVLASSASRYTNIAGAATTQIKSGAGVLRRVILNKAVSLGVITIYDSLTATGSKIGTITNPLALLQSSANFLFDYRFSTGLTVVTSAADDITVIYD